MKIRNFLPLAVLALPLLASARPAAQGLRQLRNVDGTSVEAYVYGDEHFSWAVSSDGNTLLEYNAGRWAPAVREGKILEATDANVDILRSESLSLNFDIPLTSNKKRMAALDTQGRSTFPTVGDDIHSMVVLLEYADTKFTVPNPVQTFYDMCNQEGFSGYNAKGSARDYYIATSNGLFKPTFDIYGPVQVSNTSEYYVGAGTKLPGDGSNAYFGYALKEALEILHKQGVDFSKYDYDGDGNIDNIFFFYAGYGQADSGDKTTIWPHQSDFARFCLDWTLNLKEIEYDGVKFKTYACSNELQGGALPEGASQPYLDGIGAFVHEFGHVLGLPDTYDTDPQQGRKTATPGYWDVMDSGTYNDSSTRPPLFSAYEQWVCRWLDYDDLRQDDQTSVEIPSLSAAYINGRTPVAKRLRISRPGMPTFYPEYYVFETRTRDGWDSALPDEGMLIWHVDYDKYTWIGNEVNTNGRSRLTIIPASAKSDVFPGNGFDKVNAIYDGGTVKLIPSVSGTEFAPVITSIDFDAEKKTSTFDLNLCIQIDDVTVMHQPEVLSAANRSLRFSWDKIDEASNYYVTIRRKQGTKYYPIEGYDNTPVGDEDSVTISSLSPSAWTQQIEAFVRCGNELPGTRTSNVVRFIPSELPESSVAEIALDTVVKGGFGRIEAPEGARVFNTSGIETGRENLPAGMYIVVLEGRSVKVVVR